MKKEEMIQVMEEHMNAAISAVWNYDYIKQFVNSMGSMLPEEQKAYYANIKPAFFNPIPNRSEITTEEQMAAVEAQFEVIRDYHQMTGQPTVITEFDEHGRPFSRVEDEAMKAKLYYDFEAGSGPIMKIEELKTEITEEDLELMPSAQVTAEMLEQFKELFPQGEEIMK